MLVILRHDDEGGIQHKAQAGHVLEDLLEIRLGGRGRVWGHQDLPI
jgi:hypothetical protein